PRRASGPKGVVAPGGAAPASSVLAWHCVGPVDLPRSATWTNTWITIHTARNTREGISSRTSRSFTTDHADRPRRSCAWNVTKFENPPTKKKIGMTWKIHVPSHRYEVTPTALVW